MHAGQASSSKSAGTSSGGGSLESNMPLQLALLFLTLTIYPGSLSVSREVYSATFTAAVLEVITFEILEVCLDVSGQLCLLAVSSEKVQ